MKRRSGISLMLLVVGALFLTGCGKTETPQGNEQQTTKVSSAKAILETLAPKIGKSANDIQAQNISLETSEEKLAGYRLVNDAIPPQSEIGPVIENFFEGWVSAFEADGVGGSLETYLNDDLFCNVSYELNYNLSEVLERLYSGDPEQEAAANEEMDKIFAEATTTVSIECADFTDQVPSPLEFTFSMGGSEPFWSAELKMDELELAFPDNEDGEFAHISTFKKSGEKLIFTDESYEDGNIRGEITKTPCSDEAGSHDYQVTLSRGDMSFEGCADKTDNFLLSGRTGNFADFIKKIGYTYQGERDPKTMHYHGISTQNNLLSVTVSREAPETEDPDEGEPNHEYLILGKTENGRETYWQGLYPVDEQTCEKYVNVPGLMDFGVFDSCPRG